MTVQSLLQLVLKTCWALIALLNSFVYQAIAAGGPITITHPDIIIMTIPEACQLVLEAGVMGGGEIYILTQGKPVKL
jgi:FlaA1/EpsC-like NDP-sugar epimerase